MRRAVTSSFVIAGMTALAFLSAGSPARADGNGCEYPKAPPATSVSKPPPATMRTSTPRVHLANGQRRSVAFAITRPASPTPTDVFFLLDATSSMDAAICGVQRDVSQIAIDLAKTGIDVRFGLGSFRDYPITPWGNDQTGDYVYHLERELRPLDYDLLETLHYIKADGGGDDVEAGLMALDQAATGSGQDIKPEGPSSGDTDPGQQANFRAGAVKLVLMVTDAYFREPQPNDDAPTYGPYPGYSFRRVAAEVKQKGILTAAISVGDGGREDLEKIARATGAVAPSQGADCNGDGQSDIAPGQPLVCNGSTDSSANGSAVQMGPAIVSIVKALRDVKQVQYQVSGDLDILEGRPLLAGPSIDLKRDQAMRYGLNLRCDRHPGTKHLTISSLIAGKIFASGTMTVECDPEIATIPPVLRAAAIAPAAQQPAQQPVSQPNPQPNPQANPALGVAPQAEPQLAMQQSSNEQQPPMEFSALSRRRPNGAGVFVVATLLISAGAALALRNRTSPKPAYARERSRRNRTR